MEAGRFPNKAKNSNCESLWGTSSELRDSYLGASRANGGLLGFTGHLDYNRSARWNSKDRELLEKWSSECYKKIYPR